MKPKTLYFKSYEPAIRYHISQRLTKQGWRTVSQPELASFHDGHLTLNDAISILFEYKHLNALLVQRFCPEICPETFAINDENYRAVLERLYYHKQAKKPWVLKPALLNNGDHIVLFDNIKKVIEYYLEAKRLSGEHVLQRYMEKPDLWEGKKYTFRIPGILTNYGGVYLHKTGYLNISALPYNPDFNTSERKCHITNYILDGQLAGITQLSTNDFPNFHKLFPKLCKHVQKVVKAVTSVYPDYLRGNTKAFEIFGFDFILDHRQRPLLLEVNQGPDFPMIEDHPLNESLWEPFWQSVIEGFVEPIGLDQPMPSISAFEQVLSFEQATQPSKSALKKGQKFLEQFQEIIVIQDI